MGFQPFPVDDSIPVDKDITWEVRRLHLNRSDRPSVIRAEHLRQWLIAATWDDTPDSTNWQKVVSIVQAAFNAGALAEESTW